ncbi:MAG: UDP-3-O-(3-hydroxymyristoyl)glucosamine N-acyltransferase [Brevinematales bacterium]|nr:UDP-3-O-(3-hydroxymyristoyl)glucosamine N-acyltransferase [Brevinematales bacterium]
MKYNIQSIANFVNGVVEGDHNEEIEGICEYKEGKKGYITFVVDKIKYSEALKTEVSAIITPHDFEYQGKTLIKVEDPRFAIAKIAELYYPYTSIGFEGISEKSHIGNNVKLGKNTTIMPFTTIQDNVEIGSNTVIYSGVFIGYDVKIGSNVIIKPNVVIYPGTIIGNNVIIHAGAVIGADGFGYVLHKGIYNKIPHLGRVIIEDNVEIGANTCIDRAFIGETVIGKGTKIDNLVQIAHNVKIASNCIIVSQAGIAGSTELGNNVIVAGQAGITDHAKIGDNVVIMARAGVDDKEVPPNKILLGTPAREALEQKRIFAAEHKLPEILRRVKQLEEEVEKLKNK